MNQMNNTEQTKHLSVEDMINFVSADGLGRDELALASRVTYHILRCARCREKVDAFQTVYDELEKAETDFAIRTAAEMKKRQKDRRELLRRLYSSKSEALNKMEEIEKLIKTEKTKETVKELKEETNTKNPETEKELNLR